MWGKGKEGTSLTRAQPSRTVHCTVPRKHSQTQSHSDPTVEESKRKKKVSRVVLLTPQTSQECYPLQGEWIKVVNTNGG